MNASLLIQGWQVIKKDRVARYAFIVLCLLLVTALAGKALTQWVVIYDPAEVRLLDKLRPPLSAASTQLPQALHPPLGLYLLGTDDLGRDVFARMLQGSFVSLSIGFVAMGIAVILGVLVGALAGFYGHRRIGPLRLDAVLMRITDVMLCFPTFFLVLTVVALLPPSIYYVMIVLGATGWMGIARLVRAEVLSVKQRDFVLAARAVGISNRRIVFVHILPNTLGPVLVSATIAVAGAILTESALSFLGFGVQPPDATWGNILADGRSYIFDAPWLFVIPASAIFCIVLCFNLVGESLREGFNPRVASQ